MGQVTWVDGCFLDPGETLINKVRKTSRAFFSRGRALQSDGRAIHRAIAEPLEGRIFFSAVTVLTAFDGETEGFPQGGVTISGDTLYGASLVGGTNNNEGDIYSVPLSGANPDIISDFNETDGSEPFGSLLLVGNTLYGTTSMGGVGSDGVVFSVPTAGGDPTVLANFNGADGADPEAGLIVSNNILYGTTQSGGANNVGEVFSVPITGGAVTVLGSFSGTNGRTPDGPLTLQNGILYGNTRAGGGFNGGAIYSIPITGGSPTLLADLSPATGTVSTGSLALLNNTLYGTATGGGALSKGTVFSVPIAGGTPTVLFNFDVTHGATPIGGLTLSNGILYGTTAEGGASNLGTVFGMFPAVGTPTVPGALDSTTGSLPFSSIAVANGLLYGTAQMGNVDHAGIVFSVPATSGDSLVFSSSPDFGLTNTAFLNDIQVAVEKRDTSFDTTSNSVIQLSIASGPTGAKLLGTTTASAVNGIATFSGLSLDTVGTYTLAATDVADTSTISTSFDVQLDDTFTFATLPTTGVADTTLSPVVVNAITSKGAVDTAYSGPIVLALTNVLGAALLNGTTTVNAVAGAATFSDLSISLVGSYQFMASNGFEIPAISNAVTITPNPTEVTAGIDITKSTVLGDLFPGEKAFFTLTLNNSTASLAKGIMKVQLYLTSIDQFNGDNGSNSELNGIALNTPALDRILVSVPTGKIKKISGSFTVPSLPQEESLILGAVLTPVSGLALPGLTKSPVVTEDSFDGLLAFGNVDGRAGVKIVESLGSVPVHFSMTGPGKATITQDLNGNNLLNLTGTSSATTITATAASAFTLSGITANAAIGAINAPLLNINGGISLPGGARQVRLGNLTGSAFTFGGATPAVLSLGNLANSSIVATAPLRSLTIDSFTNVGIAQSIQAAAITSFTDNGDFIGNLATTGNLGPSTIRGNLTGDMLAGTNLGTDNAPGGNDDVFGPGVLTSLHVVGNVSGSIIAAGLRVVNDTFAPANYVGFDKSKIGAVRIDGTLSAASLVMSALLPVKAFIGHQPVSTATLSRFVTLTVALP